MSVEEGGGTERPLNMFNVEARYNSMVLGKSYYNTKLESTMKTLAKHARYIQKSHKEKLQSRSSQRFS